VLRQACRQMAGWNADAGPLLLHVNLSAHHLLRSDLADNVAAALGDSGLPPECLALEITESVLMHDLEVAIVRLHELKALGVHLAIDDFGTGYSSLAYLRRFPIDALKIDKAFVDGVAGGAEESAVARAIIALAGTLHLDTAAEAWNIPSRRPPWPSSAATWPRASTSHGRCPRPTWPPAWPTSSPWPASATRPEQGPRQWRELRSGG
jgi:predicted signal transduction protein with EAL and GGDEF domain